MQLTRRAALAAGALTLAGCSTEAQLTASPSPSPSAAPSASHLPSEVVHGPRDRAQVALTFHGQGDDRLVRTTLTVLAQSAAPVTVLAVGSWLEQSPALARAILDGGHELGNHTYSHADISSLDAAGQYAEISRCAAVLRRLTGSAGRWFRPSQAPRATAAVQKQAQRAGYPTCLAYDVDSLDYTDPGPAAIVANVLNGVHNGSIVSLHLGHPGTVEALPELVAALRRRGLTPVTATTLLS
ncbi:MAG: polysaccharide deacetylase family protein [Hamadaea sp.]|uniref:polysaccharide deacetylase family protein n=1 Tax=Hamadaea sp. TaxID=2024425 RepID=UPI00180901AC|nr:polysaccharide deacetylase family protein [Hamadaea sp.]NUR72180.1 polysaccharide deacetylase family protein [Hamadaea sp.]NUT18597.1 polysaccharide deacetylase family protein [Hamadaea sp.]